MFGIVGVGWGRMWGAVSRQVWMLGVVTDCLLTCSDMLKQLAFLSHTRRAGCVFAERATLGQLSKNPNQKLEKP